MATERRKDHWSPIGPCLGPTTLGWMLGLEFACWLQLHGDLKPIAFSGFSAFGATFARTLPPFVYIFRTP